MTILSKNRSLKAVRMAGFTLLELMLAVSMFVVIGGAAFMLFRQAVPVYTQQQNLAGVNIGVQNVVAQLQQDLVNAGTGYYTGTNIPSWPVGVTIVNQSDTTPCVTGSPWTYTAGCFDTLNIITSDPLTPPQHPVAALNTNTASSVLITPTGGVAAGNYNSGDELLLVSASGLQMTTVYVTGSAPSGANILVSFNSTDADGTNKTNTANDPLNITTHVTTVDNNAAVFAVQFQPTDWILRIQAIKYQVDVTNPSNPVLERVQSGHTNVLAQQIIGFRVGAALWNNPLTDTDAQPYNYKASTFGSGYDFTIVRSVRLSIIGRTTPGSSGIYNYQNSFDGGPYRVLGAAVVINPRNLSMADN